MKRFKTTTIYIFIIFIALEVLLRLLGYAPNKDAVSVSKNQLLARFYIEDSIGLNLLPGKFKGYINNQTIVSTHTLKKTRQTHKDDSLLPKVLLLGCSYTYGWGLNDNQTYPYLIDSLIPEFDYENYGIPGGCTIQSLQQFKKLLEEKNSKQIKAIVLNYLSFHNERNCLNDNYREKLVSGYLQIKNDSNYHLYKKYLNGSYPYLKYHNTKGNFDYISIPEMGNNEFLLKRKLAINALLSSAINNISINHKEEIRISQLLIKQLHDLCLKNNIQFYLSYMESPEILNEILPFCSENKIRTIDLSFNFKDKSYFNYPDDPFHPNAKANAIIAEKFVSFKSQLEN